LANAELLSSTDMPEIATTVFTPGVAWAMALTWASAISVRSSEAPSGSCRPTSM
jgi:hypothetical protein